MKVADSSFLNLVYPFAFSTEKCNLQRVDLARQSAQAEPRWIRCAPPSDGLLRVVRDSFDAPQGTAAAQASLWEIPRASLESVHGLGAGTEAEWTLTTSAGALGFRLHGVRLALFQQGIGLLTFSVVPTSSDIADWLDFLHFVRFTRRSKIALHIRRRVGGDARSGDVCYEPYFPPLAGGVTSHPEGQGQMQDLIDALMRTFATAAQDETPFQEVFVPGQLIPFASLFLDEVPPSIRPDLLFRIENFFRSNRSNQVVGSSMPSDHATRLNYAEGQQFIISLDGTAFVALDAPETPFFRQTLPANLAGQYFLLFQLALFQRFALMRFSEEIAEGWGEGGPDIDRQREKTMQRTRDQLLSFTAGGYFSQVVQGHRQHACYQKWQECFQIDELYDRTRQALADMQGFLATRRDDVLQEDLRRLDLRMRQLAVVLGPPALCLSFVGVATWTNIYLAIGGLILGLGLGWLSWRHVRKQHDEAAARR